MWICVYLRSAHHLPLCSQFHTRITTVDVADNDQITLSQCAFAWLRWQTYLFVLVYNWEPLNMHWKVISWGPIYQQILTQFKVWINNCIHHFVRDVSTPHQCRDINGVLCKQSYVRAWMINYIPLFRVVMCGHILKHGNGLANTSC